MRTHPSFPRVCAALAIAGASLISLVVYGCSSSSPPAGTTGELGNGSFIYDCSDGTDSFCDFADGALAVPKLVALGSTFVVTYDPVDPGDGSALVIPASDKQIELVTTGGSTFKAIAPSFAGLIAKSGETLLDVTHVQIVMTDHVRIDQIEGVQTVKQGISAVKVPVGDFVRVRAVVLDAADNILAGSLNGGWTSDDDTLADVGIAAQNSIFLNGLADGKTTLHVELGGLKADLEVTVGNGMGSGAGGGGAGGGGSGGEGGGGGAGGSGGAGGGGGA